MPSRAADIRARIAWLEALDPDEPVLASGTARAPRRSDHVHLAALLVRLVGEDGDGTHDDHIELYDYPFHLPAVEWNVPEPV